MPRAFNGRCKAQALTGVELGGLLEQSSKLDGGVLNFCIVAVIILAFVVVIS